MPVEYRGDSDGNQGAGPHILLQHVDEKLDKEAGTLLADIGQNPDACGAATPS